ncbi:MAG: hypothetical protein HC925_00255 [Coleofasciculaceae cyanobacterium SM2_3_26]|nr:hypothetical protein [Coleofasciculaceae cyanobacterium SM2_3_26]
MDGAIAGGADDTIALTMPGYLWGQLAGFAGSLGLGVGTAMQLRWRSRTWVLVGVLALLYILGVTGNLPATTASNGLLWGYAVLLVTNYEGRSPRPFACTLRVVALYAGLIFLAFAIATVLPRVGEWIARPSHILQLPVFLMQWLGALLHSRYQELRAGLFYQYSVPYSPAFYSLP